MTTLQTSSQPANLPNNPPSNLPSNLPKNEPPMTRQATLLTLAALALCLAPYATRMPWWASLVVALLLAYRAALTLGRVRPMPASLQTLLLVLVALAVGAGLWQNFGTLAGRDGGGAILVVLLALKAVETHNRRDLFLLALLGFFVTITHFFFVQDTFTAAYALLSMAALCAGVAVTERPSLWPEKSLARPALTQQGAAMLKPAGRLLLQALPLAVALFVLFPRPGSPLWQMPVSSKGTSTSGLTDTVNPGAISNLATSDEVAFRAQFSGATPPTSRLYWRGPVLETFDGNAWKMALSTRELPQVQTSGTPINYTLTAEATNQSWVLALDAPASLPAGTRITRSLQVIKPSKIGSRTLFKLSAVLGYRYGLNENPAWLQYDLRLPPGNPRVRELAQGWQNLPPIERVRAGLNVFRQGGFSYTLQPPLLPTVNGLDYFVFNSKRGFCEHYASTFAFMMRAAGLPARVITGYQGAESNGNYLIVRQANAHAWTEVWIEGQGWIRVDPTAAVSPDRIERGVGSLQGAPGLAGDSDAPFKALRLRLDALQNLWNTWVIGYDGAQQQLLFKKLGLGDFGSLRLTLFSVALLLLAALPLLLRRRVRPEPLVAAYDLLAKRLKLPRLPQETGEAYLARAAQRYPQQRAEIAALVERYQALRYGPAPSPEAVSAYRQAVSAFRVKA